MLSQVSSDSVKWHHSIWYLGLYNMENEPKNTEQKCHYCGKPNAESHVNHAYYGEIVLCNDCFWDEIQNSGL